jgi:hypothetical protein
MGLIGVHVAVLVEDVGKFTVQRGSGKDRNIVLTANIC